MHKHPPKLCGAAFLWVHAATWDSRRAPRPNSRLSRVASPSQASPINHDCTPRASVLIPYSSLLTTPQTTPSRPQQPFARRTGSHTSLTHLTLAPLSTGRPLVDGADHDDSHPASAHSYAAASTSPARLSYDDEERPSLRSLLPPWMVATLVLGSTVTLFMRSSSSTRWPSSPPSPKLA